MYVGCWVVLMLYIFTTLVVFTQGHRVACALSFLSACILWLDLCVFNAWFFLPAFIYHVLEINLRADDLGDLIRTVLVSDAAQDLYLMLLGSCKCSSNPRL